MAEIDFLDRRATTAESAALAPKPAAKADDAVRAPYLVSKCVMTAPEVQAAIGTVSDQPIVSGLMPVVCNRLQPRQRATLLTGGLTRGSVSSGAALPRAGWLSATPKITPIAVDGNMPIPRFRFRVFLSASRQIS